MKTYNEIKQRIVDLDEVIKSTDENNQIARWRRKQAIEEIEILRWVLGEIP